MSSNTCTCKPCGFCNGNGYMWVDIVGNVTGYHPMDDLAEMVDCDMCDGQGTNDYCDHCRYQDEYGEQPVEESI